MTTTNPPSETELLIIELVEYADNSLIGEQCAQPVMTWKQLDLIVAALRAHQPRSVERWALEEIANRASNFADDDAAEWMPSIYAISVWALGDDPNPLLKATGFNSEPKNWPARALSQPPASGELIQATTAQAEAPIGHQK